MRLFVFLYESGQVSGPMAKEQIERCDGFNVVTDSIRELVPVEVKDIPVTTYKREII